MTGRRTLRTVAAIAALSIADHHGRAAEQIHISRVQHVVVCSSKSTFCAWPRQCGIANFGHGEIVVLHHHAPSAYRDIADISHAAVPDRSVVLLQRSSDGGETWPRRDDVTVWRSDIPTDQRKKLVFHDQTLPQIDMSQPGAMFYFGRDRFGTALTRSFVLRSIDKGHTWDSPIAPFPVPPSAKDWVLKDNHPPVHLKDGSWLVAATVDKEVWIYRSRDNGQSWEHISKLVSQPASGRYSYAGLILLRDGTLQGYTLHIQAPASDKAVRHSINAICVAESRDGGRTWGELRPIVRPEGATAWGSPEKIVETGGAANSYRSPWPMLLRDGRIIVLFARRLPPFGIGVVASSDNGRTWSDEVPLRRDGASWDLGYPVATQLDDGRIFTAYYYCVGGDYMSSPRHIAATLFRVD